MKHLKVLLSWSGGSVEIGSDAMAGLHVSNDGIEGWYDAPDSKVSLTERPTGNGAYLPQNISYSARTVTVHLSAMQHARPDLLRELYRVSMAYGRMVRVRVIDDDSDTYSDGYISAKWDAATPMTASNGTLTVVCPDPRRYSAQAHVAYLRPSASSDMGLVYSSSGVLQLPLAYGGETAAGAGTATIANGGTATAYPVITLHGNIGHVSIRDVAGTGTLAYRGSASASAPVVLDCMSRTATVNGVDVTRNLVQRTWPSIPACGSITLSCTGHGDGYIEVVSHDTYI